MNKRLVTIVASAVILAVAPFAHASSESGYSLDVLVAGNPRPEFQARGTVYIEALRGNAYALRLTNPTPYRVAVALSVDGLNTIDAKHSDAWNSSKWVLDPYESTTISGWQVSDRTARRFVFSGERGSYGAALGQTADLGVIEAVFFREEPAPMSVARPCCAEGDANSAAAPRGRADAPSVEKSAAQRAPSAPPSAAAEGALSDDYAATAMGNRTHHDVERVAVRLDPNPVASLRIRYEFRPQLVRLGVLPNAPSPLERRERAHGFDSYCPQAN